MARRAKPRRTGNRRAPPDLGSVDTGADITVVVGLGNPGRRYYGTRHNVGSLAADLLLERSVPVDRGKWVHGELSLVELSGKRFLVLKPRTYMNRSGAAVAPVVSGYGLTPSQVVVMHDDMDIPLGEFRVKHGGGTGGHLGVTSVVESLGEEGFSRIRIGVGRPPEGVGAAEYVLGSFGPEEEPGARKSLEGAVDSAVELVLGGFGDRN
jgi:peptidyl-tRNA hydrolase, PTH1 family